MEACQETSASRYLQVGNLIPSQGTTTVSSSTTGGAGWWSIEPSRGCVDTVVWPYWPWSYFGGEMNNTDKAFQVAKQLMADKLVSCKTPDDFIKLVETIAKAL